MTAAPAFPSHVGVFQDFGRNLLGGEKKNHLSLRTRSLEKAFGSEMSADLPKVTEPWQRWLSLSTFQAPSEEHRQGQCSGSQWACGRHGK